MRRRRSVGSRRRMRLGAALLAIVLSTLVLLSLSVMVSGQMAPAPMPAGLSAYDAAVLADHPVAFWDMRASGRSEADLTGHRRGLAMPAWAS